ncbi:hypothetical protein HPO96_37235 [Kribbella sandramycini]|uniref:Uncharacterized protein n=1 Tax=Kribbella sandramycini TaxID=60450 RepID=A0A7Y4P579_9ACTN|nr:hypothetical protein [Kribbella sandramycini]MBB6564449.1 hypothetical protein [Kribbella sandramycini]NOL45905.1 hypothetical protein [Kribbella sandramycini]
MELTTWHRTEVRLAESDRFIVRKSHDGLMQVRSMTAHWSSMNARPRLDLDGVRVRRDGTPDTTRPDSIMLLTWEPAAGPMVRQLPALVRTVLEAVGMVLSI